MPRQDGKPCALKIDAIIVDRRLEVRQDGTDDEHAERLSHALAAKGEKKPPRVKVRVIENPPGYKPGVYNFAIDGKHTLKAHRIAGKRVVPCIAKRATWEQAIEDAATSNQGPRALPMRNRDRARAVDMLLSVHGDDSDDPWSDSLIAKAVGVTAEMVRQHRKKLPTVGSQARRKGADGRTYQKPRREEKREADPAARLVPVESDRLGLADFEAAAAHSRNLRNLGQLYDFIHQGGTLNMKPARLAEVKEKLVALGVTPPTAPANGRAAKSPEAARPGDAVFDWKNYDFHFGVVARGPDAVARAYPALAAECQGLIALLSEFRAAWEAVRTHATTPEATK